jgi:cytochrome c oxidase subunit 2
MRSLDPCRQGAVRAGVGATLLAGYTVARAELGYNLPEPASVGARDIYDIHHLTTTVVAVLLVIVVGVVGYSLYTHRKSRGFVADQALHKGRFGRWSWVLIPVVVLGVDMTIAGKAEQVLESLWEVPKDKEMMEVKVTGHQWWWEYEYLDQDIRVESRYTPEEQSKDLYLREVDNRLVLPTHTRIRFLHTSADVNHAFWVPEIGFKKDAIAGYITETWTVLDREGVYRGQCAELCGTWHARMPIVVEAVNAERFGAWVEEQKLKMATATAEASSDKVRSKEELMEMGRNLYNKNCAACHQLDGKGLPPAFPPLIAGSAFSGGENMTKPLEERGFLKDGKIVLGPVEKHLDIVVNGIPGTSMQSWKQLNDLEIAAIVTYERNAFGNDSGEVVQPSDVGRFRGAGVTASAQ